MREEDAMEKIQIKTMAEFLKKVLPDATSRKTLLNQVLPVKHESRMQSDNRVTVKATPPPLRMLFMVRAPLHRTRRQKRLPNLKMI
jgi:hypothetical protein